MGDFLHLNLQDQSKLFFVSYLFFFKKKIFEVFVNKQALNFQGTFLFSLIIRKNIYSFRSPKIPFHQPANPRYKKSSDPAPHYLPPFFNDHEIQALLSWQFFSPSLRSPKNLPKTTAPQSPTPQNPPILLLPSSTLPPRDSFSSKLLPLV